MIVEDQMGRAVNVPERAERIVSLVPSQTELLFELGIAERVVGVTRYCLHPEHARTVATVVGGTKQLFRDQIDSLKPDLIIGNHEENERDSIESLAAAYPVWLSDITTLDAALQMIRSIGALTDTNNEAAALIGAIRAEWSALPRASGQRVLYMIWQKPFIAVAGSTFIDHVLCDLGLVNCLAAETRYPELDEAALQALKPDVVFLSSEPFPYKEKHVAEYQARFPDAQVRLVDGEMFSWYGSRLRLAPNYFDGLLKQVCAA